MRVEESISIDASAEKVWGIITDVKNSPSVITAIESVEVLDEPKSGLVGLKWKEVRKMFGKEASEIMWVTDADERKSFKTRAESHGSIYVSGFDISDEGDGVRLTAFFEGQAVSMGAKVMNVLMAPMMKSSIRKAFGKDLDDIRQAAE